MEHCPRLCQVLGRVGPLLPFSSMQQQLVEHLREHSHQDTTLKGNGGRERERESERAMSEKERVREIW